MTFTFDSIEELDTIADLIQLVSAQEQSTETMAMMDLLQDAYRQGVDQFSHH